MYIQDKKKWDEQEIKKAARIILNAEKKKGTFIRLLDEAVHWFILLIILLGNVIIAGFLVILSSLLPENYFYIILVIFAVSFGLMIEIPLRDIEKISRHKHLFIRIMLPLLAGINVFIVIGMKNSVEYFLNINSDFNAPIAASVYGLFFILPHFLILAIRKLK